VAILGALLSRWYIVGLCTLLILFVIYFFRDPLRQPIEQNPHVVLAPADGTVREIASDEKTNSLLIRTAMNVFNVHVTRAPISGVITESGETDGAHYPIFLQRATTLNKRKHLVLKNSQLKTTLIFIAGFVARQIALYVKPGDNVIQGQRLGIIKLGSEVDLILQHHSDWQIRVKQGDKTRAGETIIGVFKDTD
jgi:phosphatidylserine decarboxylase